MGSGNSRPWKFPNPSPTNAALITQNSSVQFHDPFLSNNNKKKTFLSFSEATALKPSSPENMWAIVEKTCIEDSAWKVKSVQNRRGWKTIRLFVSSTFKDFHAEREVLVKEVRLFSYINALRLSANGVNFI